MAAGGGETFGPGGFPVAGPVPYGGWARAPQPGCVPLGPLDANDVLKGVFTTVRRHLAPIYLPLLAVALGSGALLAGCGYAAWTLIASMHLHGERMSASRVSEVVLAAAVFAVPALLCAFLAYTVAATVSITLLGHHAMLSRERVTARRVWAEARLHLGRVAGTQLLTGLLVAGIVLVPASPVIALGAVARSVGVVVLGALLLLFLDVPLAIYVGVRLYPAVPVTVLEGMRPTAAMRRSWRLSSGGWWRTFGIMLLPGIIGYAATQLITGAGSEIAARFAPPQLLDGTPAAQLHLTAISLVPLISVVVIAYAVAAMIRAPLTPLTLGLLYFDKCVRKENLHRILIDAAGNHVLYAPSPLFPPPRPPGKPPTGADAPEPGGAPLSPGQQQPAKGRRMIAAGWTMRVAGTGVGLTGDIALRGGSEGGSLAEGLLVRLVGLAGFLTGAWVFLRGRLLIARGKRHTVKILGSFTELAFARYVLYLRSFADDPRMFAMPSRFTVASPQADLFLLPGLTQEELLVRRFERIGRVIAIGNPSENLPLPGATRGYLAQEDWQAVVTSLLHGAHTVALAAGTGRGTVWEFTEAVRVLELRRLILLVYCDAETYNEFRAAVGAAYAHRVSQSSAPWAWRPLPALPPYPPLARTWTTRRETWLRGGKRNANWEFPLKGIVVFDELGRARFIRFDPSVLKGRERFVPARSITRELAPVLADLESLPRRLPEIPAAPPSTPGPPFPHFPHFPSSGDPTGDPR